MKVFTLITDLDDFESIDSAASELACSEPDDDSRSFLVFYDRFVGGLVAHAFCEDDNALVRSMSGPEQVRFFFYVARVVSDCPGGKCDVH